MPTAKVAVTIDRQLLIELDQLVESRVFPNRSQAVQEALRDKLSRLRRHRLARESAKLDQKAEQAFAELGVEEDLAAWPEY